MIGEEGARVATWPAGTGGRRQTARREAQRRLELEFITGVCYGRFFYEVFFLFWI